jgi:hypothetical protein
MKKILGIALTALIAVSLLGPANAAAKKQEVDGSVALPAPYTDDTGCYAGLQRRLAILTMEQVNGVIGYHFDVDKTTWNKPFNLTVTDSQNDADLDIYYYLAPFGTPDVVVNDPLNAGAPPTVSFNTREPGGETGIVPKTAQKVIVCMYGGQLGAGAGASFHYEAGKGVKAPK